MLKCGLLGGKLSHSYSPEIHKKLGEYEYKLYEKTPEELEEFILKKDYDGLNVTIPYKQAVMPYLDELSKEAKRIGSVNTIVKRADGTLLGDNTDIYGFKYMLKRAGIDVYGKKALILGSGGTEKTVHTALLDLGASEIKVISRSGEDNYNNLEKHSDARIMINATPVGMFPNNGKAALSLDGFFKLEGVADVIYNPMKTELLLNAGKRGLKTAGGLSMLVAQAKRSAELFMDENIADEKTERIVCELSREMRNILLIGMPGSGKSTIGKELSKITGKRFIDIDELIVKNEKKGIPEIFNNGGEEAFRAAETAALKEACKLSGAVIATGGGCVKKEENADILRQNGSVFYIKRDFRLLPTDGRPLSKNADLSVMFCERKPLYEGFCDFEVINDKTVKAAAEEIKEIFYENTCD